MLYRDGRLLIALVFVGAVISLDACALGNPNTDELKGGAAAGNLTGGQGGARGEAGNGTAGLQNTGGSPDGGYGAAGGPPSSAGGGGEAEGGLGGNGGQGQCGNGIIEPPEQCDGQQFGGKTCQDYGLAGGQLICNDSCHVVVSQCYPYESCQNGVDDDTDGLVDCLDDDCATHPCCANPCDCAEVIPTTVPAGSGDTTGGPMVYSPSCAANSGSELVFQFNVGSAKTLAITLYAAFVDFSLSVRTDCGDPATEIGCVNDEFGGGWASETLVVPFEQGTYYLLVDGASPNSFGYFSLDITEIYPETNCTDLVDNDLDGALDCDDVTACQGVPQCDTGPNGTGQPCNAHNECIATGGDPICLPIWWGYDGGYCSEFCDLVMDDCSGDAQCVDLGVSTHGVCFDGCTDSTDCRPGYACVDRGLASKICTIPPETQCNDGVDNDSDQLLDCEDPDCQFLPICTSGMGATGAPCSQHNDCSANANDPLCLSVFSWPNGYCSQFCNLTNDDCPAGAKCVDYFLFQSDNGACLKTCNSPSDCALGYLCDDQGFGTKLCHM